MPLTEEQKQALNALKDVDAKEFADELKELAQPLFQEVHNRGFKTAEDRWKGRATDAEKKAKDADERAAALETEKQELLSKQPDLKKRDDEWQDRLRKAEEKLKGEIETERGKSQREREQRRNADLRASMIAKGLDPLYAEVAVQKYASRIRYREDGATELLEDGGDIPVQLAKGTTPFEALADEVRKAAEPRWVLSGVGAGGGQGGGGGGGAGGNPVQEFSEQKAHSGSYAL